MILLATANTHKAKEFSVLLPQISFDTLLDHPLPHEIIEDADTFHGNAWIKSSQTFTHSQHLSLADDSGLCVDALNGAPGIYSARYAEGSDRDRYMMLLKNLRGVTQREAHFTCALSLSGLSQSVREYYADLSEFSGLRWYRDSLIAEGYCHGKILDSAYGDHGFGYDPVFQLNDGRYVGELKAQDKNLVSHRAQACKKIYPFLKKIFDI
jgi:XTP/dITP diphosphohydrolase